MDNVVREVQLRAFSDPDFMADLVNEMGADGDVTTFVEGTDIEVPTCPSRGTYKIVFKQATGELEMTCTMTVHNLPPESNGN